jgi:hypothetical protein
MHHHIQSVEYDSLLDTTVIDSLCNEMLEAQKGDPTIGRVLTMKTEGRRPVGQEVRPLLRHWQKLHIGEDGLLRRHTGSNKQLILPRKYNRLIYKELHQEMGHLGRERVIQLARGNTTGPGWIKILSILSQTSVVVSKQRKPAQPTRAPLGKAQHQHHLRWSRTTSYTWKRVPVDMSMY